MGQLADLLAEALYTQGRLDEAQRIIEEAETTAPSHNEAWMLWQSAKAKVLPRRGQLAAARQLIAETEAESSSAPWIIQAAVLVAKVKVSRMAGEPDQAAASLHAALRIHESRTSSFLRRDISPAREPK